jgi:ribosomal protein S18 acetylase RimI-like enzyme
MDQIVLKEFTTNLKKVKYKNVLHSLTLEYNTDQAEPYIYLGLIKIKPSQQNKGWGSSVMSDILKLADREQLEVRLYATNIYGAELRRLFAFYRKHGFVLIHNNKDGNFIYRPKKRQRFL